MSLADFGWDAQRATEFTPWADSAGVEPGRVLVEFNHIFRVRLEHAELEVTTAGRLKHQATSRSELPAVGDWVVVRRRSGGESGDIVAILPRRSRFSRKVAGAVTDEQVVAANIDVAFIVMGLDGDFNVRRLERYLLMTRESGAIPVVLLTKPDLADDVAAAVTEVVVASADVPVLTVSPRSGAGVDAVLQYLTPGRTAALLGSSGVGKSTLINHLVGEDLRRTRDVRESDSRGRHTTTHRELVMLPSGGLIIDTPGMRELQLWDVGDAVRDTFEDVEVLSGSCRFSDCRHDNEPQCAVKAAVARGDLAAERLESYLKLQGELTHLAQRQDARALQEEKRQSKIAHKALRQHPKLKRG
jgi:ribosome biogenesis GTPase / thiamine phosphate phosphatase